MKDSIEKLYDYDLCLETRTIFCFGEITLESSERFIKALHLLDNYKTGTVTIKLSTEGGCVISGLSMYDAIRAMKNHVRIICVGEVSSMGTVILQAGDERCLYPRSFMMIHSGQQTISGHPKSNESWLNLYKDLDNICYEIYLEKINGRQREKKKRKYKINELTNLLDFDKILLPTEAIALGLADRIMEVY